MDSSRHDSPPPVAARDPVLLLIGLRGSGKSTIGKALATRQGRPFIDLDDRTLKLLGVESAAEAFDRFGQPVFREGETRALAGVLPEAGSVIALGGGTPTAPGAAELIQGARADGRAVVVYLRCTPAELRRRLRGRIDDRRPSLTGQDPLAEIDAVFSQRDALYQRLASRTVEDVSSIDQAIAMLEAWPGWAMA